MIWFPTAKVNLGLYVLSKRDDGFHNISTCFYPVGWQDILEIIPANKFSFTSSGITIPGNENDNLCIKAYNLLKQDYDLPAVTIHLHKIIPMGAGLGGGSSDAAFTLTGLNELFKLGLKTADLHHYTKQLGSDCSFFLYNKPMIASGKGDELQAIDFSLSENKIVVIYPEIHVNTAAAYADLQPNDDRVALEKILKQDAALWKHDLNNDFENTIFQSYPAIKAIKDTLYDEGAIYASMSGSGSAVYGIFQQVPDHLEKTFPGYSVYVEE